MELIGKRSKGADPDPKKEHLMMLPKITGICLTTAVLLAVAPTEAAQVCFCAKQYENDRHCGELEKLDADSVTIRLLHAGPRHLDRVHYAECRADSRAMEEAEKAAEAARRADEAKRTAKAAEEGRKGAEVTRVVEAVEAAVPPPKHKPTLIPIPIDRDEYFVMEGSNTIGEKLVPALIKAYGERRGLVVDGETCNNTFSLRSGPWTLSIACRARGTHTGIPALAARSADIATLSRPINAAEQDQMRQKGYPKMTSGRHETVVALDGLLMIVSPQNPIRALSLDQIARIFAGEITDWAQLGGAAGKINLYVRDEKSGTRDSFEAMVMEPRAKTLSGAAEKFWSSSDLSDKVAGDPRGIGFVGFAYRRDARALPIAQGCGLIHQPSILGIKTEDYPLSRRLFLYTAKQHSIHSHDLVTYALSEHAQPVIESAGFVNQAVASWSVQETKARVSAHVAAPPKEADLETDLKLVGQLRATAERAERLSISFRFQPNSAMLDTKAWQDVIRLADYMKASGRNKKVLLLGFADAQGPFANNLRLSQQRADEVRTALLGSGAGLSSRLIAAKGYSELLPVACNADDAGRERNRRVEVWLTPADST